MNTTAINFEMLFDLHKSKIPKELLYKLIECNIKSGDKETISILKLTLIQKWLRDTYKIYCHVEKEISEDFTDIWFFGKLEYFEGFIETVDTRDFNIAFISIIEKALQLI